MKKMWIESAEPYLQKFTDKCFVSKNVNVFGIGESELESKIRLLMENAANPSIAPYCGDGEVRLRVTASGKSVQECEILVAGAIEQIKNSEIGSYIYGIDTTLASALVGRLRENGKTVATAESCTGGLIAKRITDVAGSSEIFGYGCVTYANEAKMKLLSVKEESLKAYGAVSEQTASEMAMGVRALSGADVGIATTGIAGPGGGTAEKAVGLVYLGIASEKGVRTVKLLLKGDRDRVRILASSNALAEALKEI
jgi:nicotinamide-nucleotide amidase